MSKQTENHPFALVTGASSGIGAAFARRLAQDGYHLALSARRVTRLETLAEELRQRHGLHVDVLGADLADPEGLAGVENYIASCSCLDVLVNNAGFGGYKAFIELDAARAEEQIRLHVTALTRLSRAALPGMVARGRGALINISSRLAFSAGVDPAHLPRRVTYAATKSYINTFTEILAEELAGSGVRVQALCPGIVPTEFQELVGRDLSTIPAALLMTVEDVVTASLAGLALGETICIPGLEDLSFLTEYQESRRRLFDEGSRGEIASRYRKNPS